MAKQASRDWSGVLRRAEELALQGQRGANPLVGAVVLDPSGAIVAEGFHAGAGTAHAEVAALAALPPQWSCRASELTLLVTLEPCVHTGRTGPCVRAITQAGIGRVAYAAPDPGPHGGGGELLRRAGVAVEAAIDPSSQERLNPRWSRAVAEGRPFVTAHLAQSLDALVADAGGAGRWITGEAAREHAHAVRDRVDAIVVGAGTVKADDPALTVRLPGRPERELPVVIATSSPLPGGLKLARRAQAGHDVVLVAERDPRAVLGAASGAHVLLEGGPTLLASFIEADLVDELFLYVAPRMLGRGVRSFAALAPRSVSAPLRWDHDPAGGEPATVGEDLLLHLVPRR